MSLQVAGLLVLVVLILVGALLPLKYTAQLHLRQRPHDRPARETGADDDRQADGTRPTDG
jgi:hypothetical protein